MCWSHTNTLFCDYTLFVTSVLGYNLKLCITARVRCASLSGVTTQHSYHYRIIIAASPRSAWIHIRHALSSAVKSFRLITSDFLFLIQNNNIIMCCRYPQRAPTDGIDTLPACLSTCQTVKSKSTFCRNPLIALPEEHHSDCAFVHFTAFTCSRGTTTYIF